MADIKFDVHYKRPQEKIWAALTDPEKLAKWLMPNDFKPELGREFKFRAKPMGGWDGIAHCKVIELDPPKRLAYSWDSNMIKTIVRFTLEPDEDGTWLRFEQTGFEGWSGFWAKMFMGPGWRGKLKKTVPELAQ